MEDGNNEPTHVLLQRLITEGHRESQSVSQNQAKSHYPRIVAVHNLLFSACIDTLPGGKEYAPDQSVYPALGLLTSDISRTPAVLSYELTMESGRRLTFAEMLITRLIAASTRLGSIEIADSNLSLPRFALRDKIVDVLALIAKYLASRSSEEDTGTFNSINFLHTTIKRLVSVTSNLNQPLTFPVSIEIYDSQKPTADIAISDGNIILTSTLSYLSFVDTANNILARIFNQPQSSFLFIDLIPKFITHLKSFCSHTISSIEPTNELIHFQSNFINICRIMLTKASEQSLNCILIVLSTLINRDDLNKYKPTLDSLYEAFNNVSILRYSFGPSSWNIAVRITQHVVDVLLRYHNNDTGHDAFNGFLALLFDSLPVNEIPAVVSLDSLTELHTALNDKKATSNLSLAQSKLFHILRAVTATRKRKRDVSNTLRPTQSVSNLSRTASRHDVDSQGGQNALVYVLTRWWGMKHSDAVDLAALDIQEVFWAKCVAQSAVNSPSHEMLAEGIGLLPPAVAGTLMTQKDNPNKPPQCSFSDVAFPDLLSTSAVSHNVTIALAEESLQVIKRNERTTYLLLVSLRRILIHSGLQAANENWSDSSICQFILVSLNDKSRKVRLAAGRAAHAIIIAQEAALSKKLKGLTHFKQNILFDRFDQLLQMKDPQVAETVLVSVTLIGRSIPIERIYRCLICLFTMLAPKLNTLAEHNSTTMYKVCSPHLPQLAVFLVMNMLTAPHMLTDAMSLLGFPDPKAFLHQTLRYTLPSLIAESKKNILLAIARTLGQPVQPLCLEYVEHILAHLYLREGPERDLGIQLFLDEFQGSKKKINLSSVIISCGPSLLASLVMALGDPNEAIARTALDSIDSIEETIAEAENRRSKSKRQKHPDTINGSFLRNHILGIMSIISDNLNDVQGRRSPEEKAKIITSLGVLIQKIGPGVVSVSPQIMALLQGFLEIDNLRSVTLDSLRAFITTLTFKDLGPYIGRTVASFVGNWSAYTPVEAEKAKEILDYMIENARDMSDNAAEMLDMKHIPDLIEQQKKLHSLRSHWTFKDYLENILQRASNENSRVRLHSLIELKEFIKNNKPRFKDLTTGDVFDPIVGNLLRVTLAAADRSGDLQHQIQNAAFDCVGTLGAVDPDRIELQQEEKTMIIDNNFENYDENVKFVMSLMTNELVGAYRSTSDSRAQQDLAYAIQELLKFCGFKPELLQREDNSLPAKVKQRWASFPGQVLETLSTLLTDGRYIAREPKRRPLEYPIYTKCQSYSEWLRLWTTDLIWKTRGKQASAIFSVFKPVVRNQDVGVARYILPYLVLNVLITGEDSDRKEMSLEITEILSDQIKGKDDSTFQDKRLLSAQVGLLINYNLSNEYQTIFDLMDHLGKWTRKQRINMQPFQKLATRQRPQRGGTATLTTHQQSQLDMYTHNLNQVNPLIQSIDADLLAHAALRCRSYARALLTFEKRIFEIRPKGDEDNLQLYYEHLHEIYASLDEPDGMEGVSTQIIAPSLEHQIREHESTGRWTAAQSCWEVELQKRPDNLDLHAGLLRCLRNLGHYDTLGTHIRGVLSSHPEWREALGSFQTEGAWIVGDWQTVRENVRNGLAKYSPEYALAKVLLAMHDNDLQRFPAILHDARQHLGTPIIAAGRDGYRRAYDSALHLHMVHELEMIAQTITHFSKLTVSNQPETAQMVAARLTTMLDERLGVTMPTFKSREPLLSLRRSAIGTSAQSQVWAKNEVGALWLSSAKTARKANHFQTAYSASLQADQLGTPFSFIQAAKLIRANGEQDKALRELDAGLSYQVPKLMLKESLKESTNDSKFIDLTNEDDNSTTQSDFNVKYTNLKAKGLLLKARWISEGDRMDFNDVVSHFTDAIKVSKTREQPYYELGHYYDKTAKEDASSDQVLKEHPQQALWAIVGMYNSTKANRSERCKKIVATVQHNETPENRNIIREALTLVNEMLSLCNKSVNQDEWTIHLNKSFPKMVNLAPMNFILPLQSSMTVTLPATNKHSNSHQPFPDKPVRIYKFVDEVELMRSLVKPRKVTIIGDNGIEYNFLCKPDDDLRKDARLMDFNSMINKFLKSNSEARKRSLGIRTYTVIPLNERCGLIEWVKDTRTFRSILIERYEYRGIKWYSPDIGNMLERGRTNGPEQTIHMFAQVLKRYPKVFHEWFIEMFPEPSEWLKARMTYSRTLAVMSITGFVLGLGDRHCENILLDKNNGAVQHVDFNCLFEKGSQFEVPERVPFRLTHNLVDGLGVTGTEGIFRKAAEVTMEILRANRDSLGSVVESFLHDPLVDWEDEKRRNDRLRAMEKSGRRPVGTSRKATGFDQDVDGQAYIKQLAMSALGPIERKLQGLQTEHDKANKTVMSTSAQVEKLIREAASPYNLGAIVTSMMEITAEQVLRYRRLLHKKDYDGAYQNSHIISTSWTGKEKEAFFRSLARRSRFRVDLISLDVKTKTQRECMDYINVLDYESHIRKERIPLADAELCHEISDKFGELEDVFSSFLIDFQNQSNTRLKKINNLKPVVQTDENFRNSQKMRRYRLRKKGLTEDQIDEKLNTPINVKDSKEFYIGQTMKKIIGNDAINAEILKLVDFHLREFLTPLIRVLVANVETRSIFLDRKEDKEEEMLEVDTGDVDIALAMTYGTSRPQSRDYEKRDYWLETETVAPPVYNIKEWIKDARTYDKNHEATATLLDLYPFSSFQSEPILPLNLPIMKKPYSYHKVFENLLKDLDEDADIEENFDNQDKEYEEYMTNTILNGLKRSRSESSALTLPSKRARFDSNVDSDIEQGVYEDGESNQADLDQDQESDERKLMVGEEKEDVEREEGDGSEGEVEEQELEPHHTLEMYDEEDLVDSDLDSVEGLDYLAKPPSHRNQENEMREGTPVSENDGNTQESTAKLRLLTGFAKTWIDYNV
ncbi:hypothetical protein E3Q01_02063 [Wallemia mellicola]|uniref:non-specific serine/threonine protein kinase n=1 Tax=Wallemia mellicola TaxID=1708541 RepID=A0A4T0TKP8_9BASI|nr:hypothetical protein E3Q01_02063 [Wallemia mellicola]